MTAINLDDQIVATSYDPQSRVCTYTYEHTDGSRYTVAVSIDDLAKLGITPASRVERRKYLGQRILTHMQNNPPDDYEQQRLPSRAVEASNPGGDGAKASAAVGAGAGGEPAAIITGPGFRA